MPLYSDISSQTLVILGIAIALIFAIVIIVVFHDMSILEKSHQDLDRRVLKLRLGDMLGRLNISLRKYDHKTSDLEKERHMWICEHCPHPDKCERMFQGENIDPRSFCPNYEELKKLKD